MTLQNQIIEDLLDNAQKHEMPHFAIMARMIATDIPDQLFDLLDEEIQRPNADAAELSMATSMFMAGLHLALQHKLVVPSKEKEALRAALKVFYQTSNFMIDES